MPSRPRRRPRRSPLLQFEPTQGSPGGCRPASLWKPRGAAAAPADALYQGGPSWRERRGAGQSPYACLLSTAHGAGPLRLRRASLPIANRSTPPPTRTRTARPAEVAHAGRATQCRRCAAALALRRCPTPRAKAKHLGGDVGADRHPAPLSSDSRCSMMPASGAGGWPLPFTPPGQGLCKADSVA